MLFMPSALRQLPLGKRLPNRVLIVSALMTSLTLTACSPSNSETQGVNSDSVEQFKNDLLSVLTPEASTETQTEIEAPAEPVKQLQPNVSQQFIGTTDSQQRLAKALPELPYDITDLPPKA